MLRVGKEELEEEEEGIRVRESTLEMKLEGEDTLAHMPQ